ncbi:hypothetical protein [Paraburkholderia sp. BCC1886]|uniref:hypothetical protein n=1 Tax=Paraburkholderia sp. BCC1886 TaxID=2562670 RepID=UPI0011826268|nr:hypothetical protein [Paraburkholderia sp. BCC1886]
MALNKPETNTQGNSTMSDAFARGQQDSRGQDQSQAQRPQAQRVRLDNLGGIARLALSRSPASDVITKLHAALVKEYAKVDKSWEITLLPIDLNTTQTLLKSVIVVATRDNQNRDVGVAFHTLVLDASSPAIAPRVEMINGQQVEILKVAGDAITPNARKEIASVVQRSFPSTPLFDAAECVVPRDFNLDDEALVFQLASNAALACTTELEQRAPGYRPLDLGGTEQDSTLTVTTTFGNPQTQDVVGAPMRGDIVIEFRAGGQQIQGQQDAVQRVATISRASGFMDLVWAPAEQQTQAYSQWAPPTQQVASPNEFKRYLPRFVITDLESLQLLTTEAQLLALITSMGLFQGNAWAEAWRPRQQVVGNDMDLRDIGAVGIEANFEKNASGYGDRVDTKADSFLRSQGHQDNLIALLASVVEPTPILSVDVPECGPQSWFNGIFAAAGEMNNPHAQRINDIILQAANTLTHGNFSRHYNGDGRVALDEFNRVHLGWYTDRFGVKRDLRDVDYLAVLNFAGHRDPEVVREWSETFNLASLDLNVRLSKRKQIITGILGQDSVNFTGFARRVTIEPKFMEALLAGAKDAGLSTRTISPVTDLNQHQRAVNSYAMGAAMDMSKAGASVFNRGYGAQQQQQYGARGGFSRWAQQ